MLHSPLKRVACLMGGLIGSLVLVGAALSQTSSLAPVPAPSSQEKPPVPERIDPIVAPLPPPKPAVVAPVTRAGPRAAAPAKASASSLPACAPGERLQRKVGTCKPIATAAAPPKVAAKQTAVKSAPVKVAAPSKTAKPKKPNTRG